MASEAVENVEAEAESSVENALHSVENVGLDAVHNLGGGVFEAATNVKSAVNSVTSIMSFELTSWFFGVAGAAAAAALYIYHGGTFGASTVKSRLTNKRTFVIKATVPPGKKWRLHDTFILTGHPPGVEIAEDHIKVAFGGTGPFTGAVRLRSHEGKFLVLSCSSPFLLQNKTRAYYGSDENRTPFDVWYHTYGWGECEGNICKGPEMDIYDSPGYYQYEVEDPEDE